MGKDCHPRRDVVIGRIDALLKTQGPMTPKAIAIKLGTPISTVYAALKTLEQDKRIIRKQGAS